MERRKGAKNPLSVEWILALPIVFLTWILASGYALETEAAGGRRDKHTPIDLNRKAEYIRWIIF